MTPDPELFDFATVRKSEGQIVDALRKAKNLGPDTPKVGLALSGGGIRSATFALGVLQALHQLGLLNSVQLLSTVSGGGYIGSWLISAFRNGQKEAALEPQSEAIHHLRQYSRYLSPEGGALSADSWTILANWLRNAGLIQISVILALAALLLLPQFAVWLFYVLPRLSPPISPWHGPTNGEWFLPAVLSLVFQVIALISIRREINGLNPSKPSVLGRDLDQGQVIWRIAVPVLISSCMAAVGLWPVIKTQRSIITMLLSSGNKMQTLGSITIDEWLFHLIPVITLGGIAFYVAWIARRSHDPSSKGYGIILLATAVCALSAGVLFFVLGYVAVQVDIVNPISPGPWWPLLGPSLILLTFGQLLTLLVGVLGRDMPDRQREWWNRLSAWLLIMAASILLVVLVAIPGPAWLKDGWSAAHRLLKPAAVLGWVGTTFAGVMAAKSDKTSEGKGLMDWIARLSPYAFILGLVLVIALVLEDAIGAIELLVPIEDCRVAAAAILFVIVLIFGAIAWGRFDLNEFSMNHFYRNRLVRCYMGATNPHPHPQPFTGFDFDDDWELATLVKEPEDPALKWTVKNHYTGPYPIVNTALNTSQGGDLSVQDRKAESFVFTPAYCGRAGRGLDTGGYYRATRQYIVPQCGIRYGTTVAISGAAASPNMGYHTSPVAAFLLTVFNVRLGWWVPNPMRDWWQKSSPAFQLAYLIRELFGSARAEDRFVYLSDGGHFENLGVYELVRRHCDVIIVSDAEQDGNYHFESLAGAIRKCWIDFRVKIDINVNGIQHRDEHGLSRTHFTVGKIHYPDRAQPSTLIYLKASLTGDEATDVAQYKKKSMTFPHESTNDQFFTEDQFESYRRLGEHIGLQALDSWTHKTDWASFISLMHRKAAGSTGKESAFQRNSDALAGIWRNLAMEPGVEFLDTEFFPSWSTLATDVSERYPRSVTGETPPIPDTRKAFYLAQQMLQIMENVYLDLSLEEQFDHPDNQGWMELFQAWSQSPTFQQAWKLTRNTYGARFQDFGMQRLGLPR